MTPEYTRREAYRRAVDARDALEAMSSGREFDRQALRNLGDFLQGYPGQTNDETVARSLSEFALAFYSYESSEESPQVHSSDLAVYAREIGVTLEHIADGHNPGVDELTRTARMLDLLAQRTDPDL